MNFVVPDFAPAAAELFVAAASLVVLMVTVFVKNSARMGYLMTLGILLITAVITWSGMDGEVVYTFGNMYIDDPMSDLLKLLVYGSMAVALLYSRQYMADRNLDRAEFYVLVIYATLGMMVMISANHLLTVYIGLEMLSLSLYGMVAMDRESARSTEAAMKYFVLGALASGLLLYGMSMIYGATGSLELSGIAQAIFHDAGNRTVLMFGLVFLVAGLAFKLGVVPFHMWIPDVYHGAPTAVTLLIGSAPKLAAFAMAMRLLVNGLFDLADQWQAMLVFLAVASIILGNLVAVAQTNLKRMLAYSAISHMGFMLLGLLAGVVDGDPRYAGTAYGAAMFYVVTYVLMSLASFGMILLLARAGYEAEEIDDFKGLNKRSPWFALMMMFIMFSMAGVPFFIGFFAKLSVLAAVVQAGYVWVAVIAVLMSLVGAYYYLRVVKVMYFDEPADDSTIESSLDLKVALSVNGVLIAVLGLMPTQLIEGCARALSASFM